jgi:hypothetical protein
MTEFAVPAHIAAERSLCSEDRCWRKHRQRVVLTPAVRIDQVWEVLQQVPRRTVARHTGLKQAVRRIAVDQAARLDLAGHTGPAEAAVRIVLVAEDIDFAGHTGLVETGPAVGHRIEGQIAVAHIVEELHQVVRIRQVLDLEAG